MTLVQRRHAALAMDYCCDRKSPRGKCTKLHTVAASKNRDHAPRSLYYCLFAPLIYGCCSSRTFPVRGEPRIQRNANREVATLQYIRAQRCYRCYRQARFFDKTFKIKDVRWTRKSGNRAQNVRGRFLREVTMVSSGR